MVEIIGHPDPVEMNMMGVDQFDPHFVLDTAREFGVHDLSVINLGKGGVDHEKDIIDVKKPVIGPLDPDKFLISHAHQAFMAGAGTFSRGGKAIEGSNAIGIKTRAGQ